MDGNQQDKPISLFYSYSHRDETFRGELETHLSFLRRGGLITEWHDRQIGAGDDWKSEIDRNLASADVILLLVSADFIASDYCWGEEMAKALARHQLGEARVVPVILRPCHWQSTPLASLQAVPRDGKPVSEWLTRDGAFYEIADAIKRTITDLQQQRRRAAELARQQAEAARRAEEQRQLELQRQRVREEREQAEAEEHRQAQEHRQEVHRQAEALQGAAEAANVPETTHDIQGRKRQRLIVVAGFVVVMSAAGALASHAATPGGESSTCRTVTSIGTGTESGADTSRAEAFADILGLRRMPADGRHPWWQLPDGLAGGRSRAL